MGCYKHARTLSVNHYDYETIVREYLGPGKLKFILARVCRHQWFLKVIKNVQSVTCRAESVIKLDLNLTRSSPRVEGGILKQPC